MRLAFFFFTSFLIGFSMNALAQYEIPEMEPFEVLEISGNISSGDGKMEDVLVQLYENNDIVDSYTTKRNGKFKFYLMSEKIYTLQLSKDGYYTKRVSVNTKMPLREEGYYTFEFDIEIDSMEDKDYDEYLVEYPSALISFNNKKKEFFYDKDYSKSYFDEIEGSSSTK